MPSRCVLRALVLATALPGALAGLDVGEVSLKDAASASFVSTVEDEAEAGLMKKRRQAAEARFTMHMDFMKHLKDDQEATNTMLEMTLQMEKYEAEAHKNDNERLDQKKQAKTQNRRLVSLAVLAGAPALAIGGFAACNYLAIAPKALKEPEDLKRQKKSLMMYVRTEGFKIWSGFLTTVCVLFFLFSSGHFSSLLTLSSNVSTFSFLMVAAKIESNKTVKGVSLQMMECYILIFCCRLVAILPFDGYVPSDNSGYWFYPLCEAIGFCFAGSIVYFCHFRYKATYNPVTDTLNNVWLIAPAFVLSLILHPNLANFLPADIAWTFALYLESFAVLCQLFMFLKEGVAQAHTTHFLAAQAFAKLMSFIFWASAFSELGTGVGKWVVMMQLVQLLVMGDFIYHYLLCVSKGIPVETMFMHTSDAV